MAYDSRAHISSILAFFFDMGLGVEPKPLMWDWGGAQTFDMGLGWSQI